MTVREVVIAGLRQAGAPEPVIEKALLTADLAAGSTAPRQLTEKEAHELMQETIDLFALACLIGPEGRSLVGQALDAEARERHAKN